MGVENVKFGRLKRVMLTYSEQSQMNISFDMFRFVARSKALLQLYAFVLGFPLPLAYARPSFFWFLVVVTFYF